jgi:CHAD domain-containing protein
MSLVTPAPDIAGAQVEVPVGPPLETDADRLIEAFDRFRREIEAQLRPAVMGTDPEALHDLRVAVRRTRSGLKHSEGLLSGKARRRFMREFSRLQDVTGPARDFEVWMASLPSDDPLRFVLAGYHDAARAEAITVLASRHTRMLLVNWHRELAELPTGNTAVSSEQTVAAQRARVIEVAAVATTDADASDLHRMRKRVKELRYLTEVFAADDEQSQRKVLKKLQDALGEVQDVSVQREWLAAHVDEVGPIDVRLKELDERDAAARIAYGELLPQLFVVAC